MRRYIERVDYRHPLAPTGYLVVTGRTDREVETCTKRLGTVLSERLPDGARVLIHRDLCFDAQRHAWKCVLPVMLGANLTDAKRVLAELVLRGAA